MKPEEYEKLIVALENHPLFGRLTRSFNADVRVYSNNLPLRNVDSFSRSDLLYLHELQLGCRPIFRWSKIPDTVEECLQELEDGVPSDQTACVWDHICGRKMALDPMAAYGCIDRTVVPEWKPQDQGSWDDLNPKRWLLAMTPTKWMLVYNPFWKGDA